MNTLDEVITLMLMPQVVSPPPERKTSERKEKDSEFADQLVDDFRITPLGK